MENPFSAVAIAATAEVIVDTKEQVSLQARRWRIFTENAGGFLQSRRFTEE